MQPTDLSQAVENFLAYAVAEVFLIFGRAEIDEWQDGDAFFRSLERQHFGELVAEEPNARGPKKETGRACCHQPPITARPAPDSHRRQDRTSNNWPALQPTLQISSEISAGLLARL